MLEHIAKTSIITYKKAEISNEEITTLLQNIKQQCHCHVDHLDAIGAIIITYTDSNHKRRNKKNIFCLIDERMNYSDDQLMKLQRRGFINQQLFRISDEPMIEFPEYPERISGGLINIEKTVKDVANKLCK